MTEQHGLAQDMPTAQAEGHARQITCSVKIAPRQKLYGVPIFMEYCHQSHIKEDTGEPSASAQEINLRIYAQEIQAMTHA